MPRTLYIDEDPCRSTTPSGIATERATLREIKALAERRGWVVVAIADSDSVPDARMEGQITASSPIPTDFTGIIESARRVLTAIKSIADETGEGAIHLYLIACEVQTFRATELIVNWYY